MFTFFIPYAGRTVRKEAFPGRKHKLQLDSAYHKRKELWFGLHESYGQGACKLFSCIKEKWEILVFK